MNNTKRFFAFGCSFTHYMWPTWADILGYTFNEYQNWGKSGGGNHFIFYRLIECIERNKISKYDTVAIMWTSVAREDRFLKNKWHCPGSIYDSEFDTNYIENYTDPTGYYLTNMTLINSAKKLLDSIGCKYYFFSILPLEVVDDSYLKLKFSLQKDIESECYDLYKESLNLVNPSVYELVFGNDWHSRDHVIIPAARAPSLKILESQYKKNAGIDWPSFTNFLNNEYTTTNAIQKELTDQFKFVSWRDSIQTQRQDSHPTPLEHLEYLQKIGFELTDNQKQFANDWDNIVLHNENIKYHRTNFKCF